MSERATAHAPSRHIFARGRFEARASLLLVGALGVRLWHLGSSGLWVDEAYTVWLAEAPLGEILERLRRDDAPPVYYFAQKALLAAIGTSETAVRLLSALASWSSVLVVYLVLRRHAPRAAWLSVIALGFSTLSIYYAQQARSYALVHALTAVLIALVLRFEAEPSRIRGCALAGVGLVLLYSHNLGLWPLAAGALALLPELRRPTSRVPLLWFAGVTAIGAIPWILSVLHQTEVHELNVWMGAWWKTRSMALAPFYTGAVLTNGTASTIRPPVPLPALEALSSVRFLLWAVTLSGLGLGIATALGRAKRAEGEARLARIALLFLVVPLAGLVATSYAVGPVYVVGRTDTLALPAFAILLALGWSRIPFRWVRGILLAIWIFGALAPLERSDASWIKGSDRALASFLADRVENADALFVPALGRPTLQYYADRQGWNERLLTMASFPRIADQNPAAVYPTPLDSTAVYREEARALRRSLEERGVKRVWCVAVLAEAKPQWPRRPTPPPAERKTIDANAVTYPMSLLVHSLVGLQPISVASEFRQDWVGGDRVLLEIPRETWLDPDSLPSVEIQR